MFQGEVGKLAIKDAYEALKNAIRKKLGNDSNVAKAVSELEQEHDFKPNQQALAGRIEQVQATTDEELLDLARGLAWALGQTPERAGRFRQIQCRDQGKSGGRCR